METVRHNVKIKITNVSKLLLGRIAVRPIVTYRVAWSVGLSVCYSSEPYKKR